MIKKEIDELYKKIMEYTFSVCDSFSITKIFDQHEKDHRKVREIILFGENISENTLLEKYSKKYLEYLVSKYYYNEDIFSSYEIEELLEENQDIETNIEELKQTYGEFKNFKEYYENIENIEINVDSYDKLNFDNFFNKIFYDERKCVIENAINSYIYDFFIDSWVESNKDCLIKKERIFMFDYEYGIEYYFKANSLTKKKVLDCHSIFYSCYPKILEDLCFFKKEKLWLSSISHERKFFIFCSNDIELEHLKKIGISPKFRQMILLLIKRLSIKKFFQIY